MAPSWYFSVNAGHTSYAHVRKDYVQLGWCSSNSKTHPCCASHNGRPIVCANSPLSSFGNVQQDFFGLFLVFHNHPPLPQKFDLLFYRRCNFHSLVVKKNGRTRLELPLILIIVQTCSLYMLALCSGAKIRFIFITQWYSSHFSSFFPSNTESS